MKRSTTLFATVLVVLTAAPLAAAPEIPGPAPANPIALVGGTVHTVSGDAIENGVVLIISGKIAGVGKAGEVALPPDAQQVLVNGKHVYPGLIDADSGLGLVEIDSVRATRDQTETGVVNPNAKSWIAFNPDSELIPVTRANGVLAALSVPRGGLISGQSALMQLDGWTWEDMKLAGPAAMHLNWPQMTPLSAWWLEESPKQQMDERDRQLKTLRDTFEAARAYRQARQSGGDVPHDLRWEAMIPLLEGKLPLAVHAENVQQIEAAVAFAEREQLKLILVGGYDAPRCAALLKKHDVPVIVGGVHRLPMRRGDAYDEPFTVPARLHEAGLRWCIAGSGRFGASNARNLPYHAGTAAAYGLPPAEALRAVTLYPAQILGLGDRLGSIEQGKDATLFVADGDILETATQVEAAWIGGRPVDLNNRHKRLWEKYREKYRRQAAEAAAAAGS